MPTERASLTEPRRDCRLLGVGFAVELAVPLVVEFVAIVTDVGSHRRDELLDDFTVSALGVELLLAVGLAIGQLWAGHGSPLRPRIRIAIGGR